MKNKKWYKKMGAFLVAFAMIMSLIVPNGMSMLVEAASQGYSVVINLYDYDKSSLKDPEEPLKAKDGGPFYVVAVAKGGTPSDVWTTYAVKQVDTLPTKTTTVSFDRADFRTDTWNPDGSFKQNDYNYDWNSWSYIGHYDPANTYHMNSVTVYRAKDGVGNVTLGSLYGPQISYDDLIAQFDRDSSPEGYEFLSTTVNDNQGTVGFYKSSFKATYELRINFEGKGDSFTSDDKYIAMVEVEHKTTGTTYYVTDVIGGGSTTTLKFPVEKTWMDRNGDIKPENQKFTGNEPKRTVYLFKLKDGKDYPSITNIINKGEMLLQLGAGDTAGSYVFEGVTSGSDQDETTHVETFFDTINLKAIEATSD